MLTHILLLAINIALIVPIAVMIKGHRVVNLGMIPAIAMATYTTYRVAMAIINFRKSGKSNSPIIRELRNINLIDTLVSILLLQNTLIMVNDNGMTEDMATLSIISSTAIWLLMGVVSIVSLIRAREIR